MVDGVGGPGGPGGPGGAGGSGGPPGAPGGVNDPNDPWHLRDLIARGAGSSEREKAWVADQKKTIFDKLDKMTDVERAHHWSLLNNPVEANRQQKLFEMPPAEREAALAKEFQDQQFSSLSGIFRAQFTSLIMRNLKNVEESVKR
jgi:hypothetical protein